MVFALPNTIFQAALTRLNEVLHGLHGTSNRDGASHPASQTQTVPDLLALNTVATPEVPPPPYEDGSSTKKWQMEFKFTTDINVFQCRVPCDPLVHWAARLVLDTVDLPGVMKHGLYLTPENVLERHNHLKQDYLRERGCWIYTRSYTLVDTRWSGHLIVSGWNTSPIIDFRIHHLSADKVFHASVEDEERNVVYYYDSLKQEPGHKANYMYDDMPMDGLWPWPKQGGEVEDGEKKV